LSIQRYPMKLVIRLFFLLCLPGYLSASVVIVNGLTHVHALATTDKTQGAIRVRNEGVKETRILVYRQDLVPECGQSAKYPEANSHTRSLGDGLRTNVDEKLMAANEEYDVRYTIDLERGKSLAGTYWEVIMVEVADPIHDELKDGVHVNSKVRYAIQVIVDVGSFEGPRLSFENVVFDKISVKNAVLKVQIKNNSAFGARTNVILEVYDGKGTKLKTTPPNTRMLYPGYCNIFEIPLNDMAPGKYDCVIIADTGKDLFGSNISIQVE
jgi:hypothetical protein